MGSVSWPGSAWRRALNWAREGISAGVAGRKRRLGVICWGVIVGIVGEKWERVL